MAAKIRVYELARELGLTNKETLDLCEDLGIQAKSHSSSIEDAQADRIRRKADRDGLRRDVQPEEEEPAPKKAASKKAEPKADEKPAEETPAEAAPVPDAETPEGATAEAEAVEAAETPDSDPTQADN